MIFPWEVDYNPGDRAKTKILSQDRKNLEGRAFEYPKNAFKVLYFLKFGVYSG